MKKVLIFLLSVLVFGLFALWLMDHPGTIVVSWLNYEVTTSVAVVAAFAVFVFLVVYILRLPVLFVRWVRRSLVRQKQRNREVMMQQVLNAIAAQDEQTGKRLASRIDKAFSGKTSLNLLLKALLNPTPEIYQKLAENPETELAGWKGLMAIEQKNGNLEAALALCEKAFAKYKNIPWLAQETLQLQVLNEKWDSALATLEQVKKLKIEPEDQYKTQKATLLLKLGKPAEAFKTAPWVPQAALEAAKASPTRAQSILMTAWEKTPAWELYKAYADLFQKEAPLARYKRIEKFVAKHPGSKVSHIALADSALQAKLWGQAKKELDDYLAAYSLTVPVATMMAFYEQEARHDTKEAQKWVEKMKTAEPLYAFTCSKCGHAADIWTPTCPMCNGFATMETL